MTEEEIARLIREATDVVGFLPIEAAYRAVVAKYLSDRLTITRKKD